MIDYRENLNIAISKMDLITIIKRLTYSQWIILYDLLNGSYYHIKDDLNKGKISNNDIENVLKNIHSLGINYNKEYLFEMLKYA